MEAQIEAKVTHLELTRGICPARASQQQIIILHIRTCILAICFNQGQIGIIHQLVFLRRVQRRSVRKEAGRWVLIRLSLIIRYLLWEICRGPVQLPLVLVELRLGIGRLEVL